MTESASANPVCAPASLVVRKASMRDIPPMLHLINAYAGKGIMLPRTELDMAENIRDFAVAWSGDVLAGCGALHFYTPTSAEVRSLAVSPALKGAGVGRALVGNLEVEARASGLEAMFAFTYVPGFFRRMGFTEVERGDLPLKAWKDCMRCPKFHCCDEIAVLKSLTGDLVHMRHNRSEALLHISAAIPRQRAH